MSWVNSNESSDEVLQRLRGALIDEIGATRLYDDLIKAFPKYKRELKEIKDDEINHQGVLLRLILMVDPTQTEFFNAGLDNQEAIMG